MNCARASAARSMLRFMMARAPASDSTRAASRNPLTVAWYEHVVMQSAPASKTTMVYNARHSSGQNQQRCNGNSDELTSAKINRRVEVPVFGGNWACVPIYDGHKVYSIYSYNILLNVVIGE